MGRKILAVDDDPGTREFYRCAFEDMGYNVITASEATGAIIACHEYNPDALLLDWDMPGGGGKMVFEKICCLLGRKLPVLFVTGAPQKVDINKNHPKVRVLKKPASVATLISSMEALLED